MRTVLRFVGIAVMTLITVSSCGGGGDDSPPPPAEANLAVTTDPGNGTVQPPALGPYNLKVTITSTMPPNGVKIDVTAKRDDGTNTVFFSTSVNRTCSNDFTITSTPVLLNAWWKQK